MSVTEPTAKTKRHTPFYLAAGSVGGPLVIFLHGRPELSISWPHQLPAPAALSFSRNCGGHARRDQTLDVNAENIDECSTTCGTLPRTSRNSPQRSKRVRTLSSARPILAITNQECNKIGRASCRERV